MDQQEQIVINLIVNAGRTVGSGNISEIIE